MTRMDALPAAELQALHGRLQQEYAALKARGLKLDMTRGKPAPDQLDLSNALMTMPGNGDYLTAAGEDARNYGGLQGLAEIRALFAPVLDAPAEQIVVGNNSSLALMHDCLAYAMLFGVPGGDGPWTRQDDLAFLCPVPGYDRHFGLTEGFGMRLIAVPMTGEGPDMDAVEELAADPKVKGIWCVPKYSNPSGETYSARTVQRLAAMKTGAADFRIMWDNAYALHHLSPRHPPLANMLAAAAEAGHAERPLVFASTSKVTLAGAGLAFLAGSPTNIRWYMGHAGRRTIGPDKLNQLRHMRFLKDAAGIARLMEGHRALIAPKFAAVADVFRRRLGPAGIARWSEPEGGYFTVLHVEPGTASRVVALAKEAGLALTPAGATHPYGRDPDDAVLRIAPTYPTLAEVTAAAEAVALCTLLAASEKRLAA